MNETEELTPREQRKIEWQRLNTDIRHRWNERHIQYRAELLAAKAAWRNSRMDWLAWVRIKDDVKTAQRDREAFWIGHDTLLREGKWQDTEAMRLQAFRLGMREIGRRIVTRMMRRGK